MKHFIVLTLIIFTLYLFIYYFRYDKNCNLRITLRNLFADHAVYTKFFVQSVIFKFPDIDVIKKRLIRNQEDIGNGLRSKIGDDNANKLISLLKEHIKLAAQVVSNLMVKVDKKTLNYSINKLFENSDNVSKLISSLNLYKLPLDIVQKEFRKHNEYVAEFATKQINGDYIGVYQTYDKYFNHMMHFSDMLYSALI